MSFLNNLKFFFDLYLSVISVDSSLYAEGQRRYVKSLSSYVGKFLEQMERPNVESIEGLSQRVSRSIFSLSAGVRPT